MNKKILIVAALLMVVCVTGAFAWGIGVQGGWNKQIPGNLALTLKFDPWAFAGNFYLGNGFGVGITADYWFIDSTIVGPLNWFLGGGLGGTVIIPENNDLRFSVSARLPVGLNLNLPVGPVKLEPYLQLVPMLWLGINPFRVDFDFDAALGLRVHF